MACSGNHFYKRPKKSPELKEIKINQHYCLKLLKEKGYFVYGLAPDIQDFNDKIISDLIESGLSVLRQNGLFPDTIENPETNLLLDEQLFIKIFSKFPHWCAIFNEETVRTLFFLVTECGSKTHINLLEFLQTIVWLGDPLLPSSQCVPAPLAIQFIGYFLAQNAYPESFKGFRHHAQLKEEDQNLIIWLNQAVIFPSKPEIILHRNLVISKNKSTHCLAFGFDHEKYEITPAKQIDSWLLSEAQKTPVLAEKKEEPVATAVNVNSGVFSWDLFRNPYNPEEENQKNKVLKFKT